MNGHLPNQHSSAQVNLSVRRMATIGVIASAKDLQLDDFGSSWMRDQKRDQNTGHHAGNSPF
jgi:hypothetical protein